MQIAHKPLVALPLMFYTFIRMRNRILTAEGESSSSTTPTLRGTRQIHRTQCEYSPDASSKLVPAGPNPSGHVAPGLLAGPVPGQGRQAADDLGPADHENKKMPNLRNASPRSAICSLLAKSTALQPQKGHIQDSKQAKQATARQARTHAPTHDRSS